MSRGDESASSDSTAALAADSLGEAPVLLGLFAATITLVGAARPIRTGTDDPVSIAIAGLAALALVGVFGVRYGALSRRLLAPAIALASLGVGVLSVYGLSHGYTSDFGVFPVANAPSLLVALVGAGLTIAAAAAIFAELTSAAVKRRTVAATGYGLLGPLNLLTISVWWNVLALLLLLGAGIDVEAIPETSAQVVTQGAMVLGTITTVGGALAWTGRDWSYLDLRALTLRDLSYIVGGAVALAGAAILISLLLGATGTESAEHSSFEQAEAAPEILLVLAVASILVIGPFEELLYRNVVQKGLYEYFSKPGAVIVSSVAFASVHALAYGGGSIGGLLVSLGVVFVLSIVLGAIYARTDNLFVPALLHSLYNAYVYYSQYATMVG